MVALRVVDSPRQIVVLPEMPIVCADKFKANQKTKTVIKLDLTMKSDDNFIFFRVKTSEI